MHFDVAPRVANRLDIEIRALSRKLREQMTPGSGKEEEGGSSGLRHTIPAPFSVILPTLEQQASCTALWEREVLHVALRRPHDHHPAPAPAGWY